MDLPLTDTEATADSASLGVSGLAAPSAIELNSIKESNGHTCEVELVVTDASGNTASETATEAEDGS